MNSTGASMHGPGMDTFIGSFGNMTDEGEDSESQGEQADDEEEEESIEQKTVATMESTLIQSGMDQSLPAQQPRLTDASLARVKLREMENIRELDRQVELKRQERERQLQIVNERKRIQQLRDREKAIQTT